LCLPGTSELHLVPRLTSMLMRLNSSKQPQAPV
jgi:hypothetical protein